MAFREVASDGSIRLTDGPPVLEPFMSATQYKAQILPTNDWYNIEFWSPRFAHPDITMSGGAEGRSTFTLAKAGLYDIRFCVMFRNEVNSNGVRGSAIVANGVQLAGHYAAPVAAQMDYVSSACETVYRFANPGAVINFRAIQSTGGNVTIHSDPYTQCSIRRLSA